MVPEALTELWAGLTRASALAELAVVGLCMLIAWGVVRRVRGQAPGSIWFGEHGVDGVLFPLLALALVVVARYGLAAVMPVALLRLAVAILASLAIIRTMARVLRVAFPDSPLVRALERTLSWLVWIVLVLWLTGALPIVMRQLEAVRWTIGGADVSVRSIVDGVLTAIVAMVAVLWLSAAIEARLLAAERVNLSVRKMAANATRAGLLLVGLLTALSAAGIPLTALSVFGGALGVGIGFGLQKLASNYISGFVILAERSLRIGDLVKVDGFEGRIKDITTRYTVVRADSGREALVPNDLLITQRVENLSFADTKVSLSIGLQVAHGTDVQALLPRLRDAVSSVPRVLANPACTVQLTRLGPEGLELTVGVTISDVAYGEGNVRSDVNLAILRCLDEAGVELARPLQLSRPT